MAFKQYHSLPHRFLQQIELDKAQFGKPKFLQSKDLDEGIGSSWQIDEGPEQTAMKASAKSDKKVGAKCTTIHPANHLGSQSLNMGDFRSFKDERTKTEAYTATVRAGCHYSLPNEMQNIKAIRLLPMNKAIVETEGSTSSSDEIPIVIHIERGSASQVELHSAPCLSIQPKTPDSVLEVSIPTGDQAEASFVREIANQWPPKPDDQVVGSKVTLPSSTSTVGSLTEKFEKELTMKRRETEGTQSASAQAFSISKLVPVLTKEMEKYTKRYKNFSYKFGWKGELTAYVSDIDNLHTDDLKKELEKHLCQHMPKEHVKVEVIPRVPTMKLCCGGIGTTLQVGEVNQLVGLYLQYHGKGAIFWVSSAHGLLSSSDGGQLASANITVPITAADACLRIRSQFAKCGALSDVELFAQYAALSYTGVVISHTSEILDRCQPDRGTKIALQQPLLCHSVDIMLGPTPLTNWHLRDQNASYAFQLKSAAKGCGHPPLCLLRDHRSTNSFYTISTIREFEKVIVENSVTLDMSDLQDRVLYSYLGEIDLLARGVVSDPPCNGFKTNFGGREYLSQNMLLIEPMKGSCRPRQGHSGSVWVQKSGEQWEAVAITCAVIETDDIPAVEMWLAAPLCACLLALTEKYPQVFEDHLGFQVVM